MKFFDRVLDLPEVEREADQEGRVVTRGRRCPVREPEFGHDFLPSPLIVGKFFLFFRIGARKRAADE